MMSYKLYEIKTHQEGEKNSETICIRRFSDFEWLR
jgi:hypothetical protein